MNDKRKQDPIHLDSRQRERQGAVDKISRETGLGSMSSALTNNLSGFNHRIAGNLAPINRDMHGLTFFTRPRLNLTYHNVASSRQLMPLLDEKELSIYRYVRALLDPVGSSDDQGFKTRLVDPENPFMPVLTNNLLSLSGWPDITADTYTSTEGIYKEAYSLIDGVARNFSTFDLTANFRNIAGDPISLLFMAWTHYAARVYEGVMVPRPEYIINNRVDYNTRIYRLVLNQTREKVQKIAACGAAFPMASPYGAAFNFNSERPYSTENEQISIPFRCMGADYQDPVLIMEFNATVAMYNRAMRAEAVTKPDVFRTQRMSQSPKAKPKKYLVKANGRNVLVKLDPDTLKAMNYSGYPYINPKTFELEWWAKKTEMDRLGVY